jgi:predicted DNA-binding transcriptional regulator AlpA
MDITKLINSGTNNITVNVTPQDLKKFASDIAQEFAALNKPAPQKQPKYLTSDEVRGLLSISRVTLWQWDKKGITKPHRLGNLKRYKLSDIEQLMTSE